MKNLKSPATKQDLKKLEEKLLKKIADNSEKIESNSKKIESNSRKIDRNSKKIDRNRELIEENRKAIEENRKAIEENRKAIEENSKKIDKLALQVIKNSESIEEIKKNMVTKEDHREILNMLDKIMAIVKRLDEERIFTVE